MAFLKKIRNILSIPELVKKLVFTLGVLIVSRLGSFIPVVGINVSLLKEYMSSTSSLGGILSYLDIFTGGSLQSATLFALGIGPYITASIMMQMLTMAIPHLEALNKEGEYGRKVINQYTRYLAICLSLFYSISYIALLEHANLVQNPGFGTRFMFVLSITAASTFVMWLGEQISLRGLGNGSSMIIFAGIVSRYPSYIIKMAAGVMHGEVSWLIALLVLAIFVAITASIVFLEKGDRKVPVQYPRRMVGQRMYAGQSSYIPFKINPVGVMPVIFASTVLSIPIYLTRFLASWWPSIAPIADVFTKQGLIFNILDFGLIVFFMFFYTALVYNPQEMSQNLKRNGGFIPGLRPGKQTADFFNYLLDRIGLVGAIYLGILAVVPNIVNYAFNLPFPMSGTSMLILVGVALELASQIESYLIENRYEGFLTVGRMKQRLTR